MSPKNVAKIVALLNPDLAREILNCLESVEKLGRENQELRRKTVDLVAEMGSCTQANQEIAALKAALTEERVEFAQFRRRLAAALKPVGIEKGLLDIELAAVRTQELAAALSREAEQIEQTDKARRDRDLATEDYARCREAACEAVRLIDDDKVASARGVLAAELLK